ncbi:MAG: hypothetical protein ACRDM7_14245 [Thermoleophilaceae bacterium]
MPKAIVTEKTSPLAMMEEVVERLDLAMKKVVANRGAPGPDGLTIGALREQWPMIARKLRAGLLDGLSAWCDPPGDDPQGDRRAARPWHSQRGRSGGDGGRAAGSRTCV